MISIGCDTGTFALRYLLYDTWFVGQWRFPPPPTGPFLPSPSVAWEDRHSRAKGHGRED